MHLVPTDEEVIELLRETGAIRQGHFEHPDGTHTAEFLEVALAFRYYQFAKILSVGLSRKLRGNSEIRAMIKELSIVCPNTGGMPVAYGVSEALRARQVYWAEQQTETSPMHFRQFIEPAEGEKVLLVDDILRSGRRLAQLRQLVESRKAKIVGLAVAVYAPHQATLHLNDLPLFHLAQMAAPPAVDPASCDLCHRGVPLEKIWS